jgi:hypothetical protein
MAFGEMCKEANRLLNGDESKVKVLLSADVKANCVTVQLSVVQTLWDSARTFLSSGDTVTAKTILEWIGIISGTGAGLLKFLLWKRGRKEQSSEVISNSEGNQVIIRVVGDNNTFTISPRFTNCPKAPR